MSLYLTAPWEAFPKHGKEPEKRKGQTGPRRRRGRPLGEIRATAAEPRRAGSITKAAKTEMALRSLALGQYCGKDH